MKTGAEIAVLLGEMKPIDRPDGFVTSPLGVAAGATGGNPDAKTASEVLGWPLSICEAIDDAFYVEEKSEFDDGWPPGTPPQVGPRPRRRYTAKRLETSDGSRVTAAIEKRKNFYEDQFTLGIRAGEIACLEHDNPGSSW